MSVMEIRKHIRHHCDGVHDKCTEMRNNIQRAIKENSFDESLNQKYTYFICCDGSYKENTIIQCAALIKVSIELKDLITRKQKYETGQCNMNDINYWKNELIDYDITSYNNIPYMDKDDIITLTETESIVLGLQLAVKYKDKKCIIIYDNNQSLNFTSSNKHIIMAQNRLLDLLKSIEYSVLLVSKHLIRHELDDRQLTNTNNHRFNGNWYPDSIIYIYINPRSLLASKIRHHLVVLPQGTYKLAIRPSYYNVKYPKKIEEIDIRSIKSYPHAIGLMYTPLEITIKQIFTTMVATSSKYRESANYVNIKDYSYFNDYLVRIFSEYTVHKSDCFHNYIRSVDIKLFNIIHQLSIEDKDIITYYIFQKESNTILYEKIKDMIISQNHNCNGNSSIDLVSDKFKTYPKKIGTNFGISILTNKDEHFFYKNFRIINTYYDKANKLIDYAIFDIIEVNSIDTHTQPIDFKVFEIKQLIHYLYNYDKDKTDYDFYKNQFNKLIVLILAYEHTFEHDNKLSFKYYFIIYNILYNSYMLENCKNSMSMYTDSKKDCYKENLFTPTKTIYNYFLNLCIFFYNENCDVFTVRGVLQSMLDILQLISHKVYKCQKNGQKL